MLDDSRDDDRCACSNTADATSESWPVEYAPVREGRGFRIYSLLPRLRFTWGNIDASGSLEYISPRYVRVEDVQDAILVVRIHEASAVRAGYVDIEAQTVSFSDDDPTTAFVSALPAGRLRIPAEGTSGRAVLVRLASDLGSADCTPVGSLLDGPGDPAVTADGTTVYLPMTASGDVWRVPLDG